MLTVALGVSLLASCGDQRPGTTSAGMSCELIDVRVHAGAFSPVDIPCDTGIR